MAKSVKAASELVANWLTKLTARTANNPHVGRWAGTLWTWLLENGAYRGPSTKAAASASGVPLKFMPRALATLERFSLVCGDSHVDVCRH